MEKRLIAILSTCLVGTLIVIAYQAGRLSVVRQNQSNVSTAQKPAEPPASTEPPRPAEVIPIPPPPALSRIPPVERQQEPLLPPPVPQPRVEQPLRPEPPRPAPQPSSSAAIVSYFAKVDAIAVEGSGDPNTFAQGIIGGIQSGDFSQMDKLVNNAKLALSQATRLQPPPAAAEYHRRLIETLSESVTGLEKFRDAIAKSDLDSITSVAQQLQNTQRKVNDLESMKKQLLGH